MASFEKGHLKIDDSGRKKGSKNQNAELRQQLRSFAIDNFDEFVKRMFALEDKDFCTLFEKLLKYNIPAVSSIKFEDSAQVNNAFSLIRSLVEYKDKESSEG